MNRVRVLIADDHAYVLEGLVNLLKDKFDVVAAVTSGSLLVDAATRLRPDVVVTDISMPGLNGIEAFEQLQAAGLEAKVIVLTLHSDADLAAKLIRSGCLRVRDEAAGNQRARDRHRAGVARPRLPVAQSWLNGLVTGL